MKVFILAAGLGTRLKPLTDSFSKPALPIVGIPSLWYPVWHLKNTFSKELRSTDFAINHGHASETLLRATKDPELTKALGVSFHESNETSQILGSSGALWKIKEWVGTDALLVSNGDSISFPDWKKLLSAHKKNKSCLTLHVRKFESQHEAYANIEIDQSGKVTGITAKSNQGLMFSGNYIIEKNAIDRLPSGYSDLRPALLEPLIKENRLYAVQEDVPWFDVGNVPSYAEANFRLLEAEPRVRSLIEIKMKEISRGIWVSKQENPEGLMLMAPAILCGDLSMWKKLSKNFGPEFIGIEPGQNDIPVHEQAVVLKEVFQKFKISS